MYGSFKNYYYSLITLKFSTIFTLSIYVTILDTNFHRGMWPKTLTVGTCAIKQMVEESCRFTIVHQKFLTAIKRKKIFKFIYAIKVNLLLFVSKLLM